MSVDLTRIGVLHVTLLAATGGVAYVTHWAEPGSVLLGGAVMGVNFCLLRLITGVLRRSVTGEASARRVAVAVGAMAVKFAVFLGMLAALFWRVPVDGMSFAFGVTLLLVACVLEAARCELTPLKGAS